MSMPPPSIEHRTSGMLQHPKLALSRGIREFVERDGFALSQPTDVFLALNWIISREHRS